MGAERDADRTATLLRPFRRIGEGTHLQLRLRFHVGRQGCCLRPKMASWLSFAICLLAPAARRMKPENYSVAGLACASMLLCLLRGPAHTSLTAAKPLSRLAHPIRCTIDLQGRRLCQGLVLCVEIHRPFATIGCWLDGTIDLRFQLGGADIKCRYRLTCNFCDATKKPSQTFRLMKLTTSRQIGWCGEARNGQALVYR